MITTRQIACLIALFASGLSAEAMAVGNLDAANIRVLGLFKNTAILNINDQRTVLRVGETQHAGLRLLAANSEKAVFEIKGKRFELSLSDGGAIRTGLPSSASSHMAQLISNGGLYSVTGAINGQLADFVVDTGATYVTMSPQMARHLHLDYRQGRQVGMNTANGRTTARVFTIKSVRIGGIELHDVDAAVTDGMSPSKILLGMSFLNQVDMKHGPGLMVLKQRI